MPINQQYRNGFTLLELLIAISIFSVLSVMAYGGLKIVLDSRNSSQIVAERTAKIQLAMLLLSNDLRQAVVRSVRDGFGARVPTMMTQQSGEGLLEWTRAGHSNPAKLKRSNLQRVAYKLSENKLVRITWPVLDRAQDTEASESVLLAEIESLEWRFNEKADSWGSNWPPASAVTGSVTNRLPRAVEIKITISDLGEVRRLFLLPQS